MKECNLPALTKESSPEVIENYFRYVLEKAQTGEEFPINLDDVWQSIYTTKSHAVSALQRDFIQDVDYQVLTKSRQNLQGGRPVEEYYLSVSCLEFFVARKKREVFDIYRKVFHATYQKAKQEAFSQPKPKKQTESLVKTPSVKEVNAVCAMIDKACKQMNLSDATRADMYNKAAKSYGLPFEIDYTKSKGATNSLSNLLKKHGNLISAKKFNILLHQQGYLNQYFRDTKEGKKPFYSLTDKGVPFGENYKYTDHPEEDHQRYFEEGFVPFMNKVLTDANFLPSSTDISN